MKRRIGFLGFGLVAALTFGVLPRLARAQDYVADTLAADPLAYWRFESANDTSLVNGFTSTYVGTATSTAPGGGAPLGGYPNNVGLALDGGGNVSTNLSTSFTGGGTIMCWVNLAELPSAAGRIFSIAGESQNGNDFDLQIDGDNKIDFYTDSGSSTEDPTALTTGTWYNIAATLDNANHVRTIYVNGQLVAQDTGVATHGASGNTFYIGESNVFTGRFFNGTMDEVAVWDSALSAGQISSIYAGVATPEPASVLLLVGGVGLLARRRLVKRRQ